MLIFEQDHDILGQVLTANYHQETLCDPLPGAAGSIAAMDELLLHPQRGVGGSKKNRQRIKSTCYFSKEAHRELRQVKEKLRSTLATLPKSALTQSSIINAALRIVLADFGKDQLESPLVRELLASR